jgi:hypothetical protein
MLLRVLASLFGATLVVILAAILETDLPGTVPDTIPETVEIFSSFGRFTFKFFTIRASAVTRFSDVALAAAFRSDRLIDATLAFFDVRFCISDLSSDHMRFAGR